jgi:hypothetical protein
LNARKTKNDRRGARKMEVLTVKLLHISPLARIGANVVRIHSFPPLGIKNMKLTTQSALQSFIAAAFDA